jgi:spermidine synthase
MQRWIDETLHEDFRFSMKADRVLHETHTEYQHLVIFDNPTFGRVMMLDGVIQCTSADEFIYHEMLAHTPVIAHGRARRMLIIGGGDGGTLREALKHEQLSVTLCEIDASVIDLSRRFFPMISQRAFDHPRAEIVIADGVRFLADTSERFDIIAVDSTDPIGPAAALFTRAFYEDCRKALTPGGVLITQSGIPFVQAEVLRQSVAHFRSLFVDASALMLHSPTYIGGPMALGWATDDATLRKTPLDDLRARFEASGISTRYYSPEVHQAAFALPGYVAELVLG